MAGVLCYALIYAVSRIVLLPPFVGGPKAIDALPPGAAVAKKEDECGIGSIGLVYCHSPVLATLMLQASRNVRGHSSVGVMTSEEMFNNVEA